MATVNVEKLLAELLAAGLPVEGCASDGRIDFLSEATAEQRQQAAAILVAHDPAPLIVVTARDVLAAELEAATTLAAVRAAIVKWAKARA